jgi:hypothetical protein
MCGERVTFAEMRWDHMWGRHQRPAWLGTCRSGALASWHEFENWKRERGEDIVSTLAQVLRHDDGVELLCLVVVGRCSPVFTRR